MRYGFLMATITLKDIPRPIHSALKARARQHGRSLNREALACLEATVSPVKVDVDALLLRIRDHRATIPGHLDEDLLIAAKHAGRP